MPARGGAAVFVNPMTALAMLETARLDGHAAIIHTAAASNLGQMLLRACIEDEVPLVAVVRREEQAELLRAIGARHVCDSSAADFDEALVAALAETGASVAFDAIGGGDLASRLIAAIERAGDIRSGRFQPVRLVPAAAGLHLPAASTLRRACLPRIGYGMVWGVGGWAMPPVLERVGPARAGELMARVVSGLDTTFASHFGETITLAGMLDRETMLDYSGLATGRKFLVEPWFLDLASASQQGPALPQVQPCIGQQGFSPSGVIRRMCSASLPRSMPSRSNHRLDHPPRSNCTPQSRSNR